MSAQAPMGECCVSGKLHSKQHNLAGHDQTIDGVPTYVSEPANKSKAKTMVVLTDIFGYKLPNVRLLADEYAKAGFYVYIPDAHEGDSLPPSFLDDIEPNKAARASEDNTVAKKAARAASVGTTLPPWSVKHREAVSKPIIDKFIDHVKHIPGTGKVGALGFCWGGRYAILATHGGAGGVDAGYACHPAMVGIPADLDPVSKPLSLAFGDQDSLVNQEAVGQFIDVLGKKKDIPHEIRIYEDQIHGFAVRGDENNEKDKKAMDDAFKQGIDWFNKYLS